MQNKNSGDTVIINNIVKQPKTGKLVKQILLNQNGYVKPGELVAIMGPSGSGKTSLLNVLAGRLSLSKGSTFSGEIAVNGKKFKKEDFGKIAAFVQQDDVLVSSMTPRETFEFAVKMTSDSSNVESKAKV
jgi:ABC-type multidrug transport system ATPase subunit